MAIGINDLDDDDIMVEGNSNQPVIETQSEEEPITKIEDSQDDIMLDFLKSRGIDDPSKIKFEDENNQLIERDWKDLSKEEKLNILNTPLDIVEEDNNELTDEEIELLSTIRQSNMTPSEYIKQISAGEVVQEPTYKIDDLSDDEIYLLDFESRVGELSDEEAAQALSIAKQQSEELYKKQIEGIRKEYKEREDLQNQQAQAQLEQEQQEAFNQYQEKIIKAIDGMTSIGNLDLNFEDSDKEILAEFMLSQDETGRNYLYEALQDPETLTRAAWFILNGEEAFNSITDYFKNQIKLVSENQYKKGFEDGKNGSSKKPTLVIANKNNSRRQINSIEELDDED